MAGNQSEVRGVGPQAAVVVEGELGPREQVRCVCSHLIFDGLVVKSRVVRLLPRGGAEALCRCKRWLAVPLSYAPAAKLGASIRRQA